MQNHTIKIDLNYMATYTALFNEVVVSPDSKQLEIIKIAIKTLKDNEFGEKENRPKEIKYLIETWIEDSSDCKSVLEKLLYLQIVAQQYLENKEIESKEKEAAAQEDYIQLSVELDLLILTLKDVIAENAKLPSNRMNDVLKNNRIAECFRNFAQLTFDGLSYSDIYYYMSRNKEFGNLIFTSCLRCWDIKRNLLWECIKRNDIDLVKYYMSIMVSKCSDKNSESEWNAEAAMTVSQIANGFETDLDVKYGDFDVSKAKETIALIANEIIPYLDEKNRAKVNTSLIRIGCRNSDDGYVSKLINDVSNYAKTPRPRGYGGRVNEISAEIRESFKTLPKLGRYDILEKILHILIEAGPNLKPINGYRWLDNLFFWGDDAACIHVVKNCPDLMKIWFGQNRTSFDFDRVMMKIDNDDEAVRIFNELKR